MTTYKIIIEVPFEVPESVLVDAIGHAVENLREKPKPQRPFSVRIVERGGHSLRQGRRHPFDGPEVFDDTITNDTTDDIVNKVFKAIGEDFPYLRELFQDKRAERPVRRNADIQQPLDEGEWELPGEDHIGED